MEKATREGLKTGADVAAAKEVGRMIVDVLRGLQKNGDAGDGQVEEAVKARAMALCGRFPIYP